MISSTATTAAVAPLSSTTHRIDAMGSDDGDDGFVMNLAGMEDAGGDDSERRGNPRKRTVMRAPRKGRHRGWLGGKSTDGAAKPGARPAGRGPGRGSGARGGGRDGGGRGRGGGRGAQPADWAPTDADSADVAAAAAVSRRSEWRGGKDGGGRGGRVGGRAPTGGRGGRFGGGRGGRGAAGVGTLEVADGPSADDDDGEFNPGDWAALMRKAVTPLTDAETASAGVSAASLSAKATSRVFGADPTTWEGVGLPEPFCAHLRDPRVGFPNPTRVQQRAVPHILRGDDVLIRAETGSGKTLAYMCPLLAAIGAIDPRVSRDEGTRALVMVPTRELAAQVLDTAAALSKPYHWVVCGGVMGGENKQKEKARLRKGVCVLVATPGRLLDHLRHTAAFKADLLRWLVLDEADRMLDVGFEEDLNAILADLNRRAENAGRCTALLSATLTAGTSRLIDLAMTDPVTIEIDPEEPEYVGEGYAPARAAERDDGLAAAANAAADGANANDRDDHPAARETALAKADVKQMVMRMPEQLRHTAVEVPVKARLAALAGLLAGWMRGSVPKVMVFLSSCESVEFHYRVLSWLAAGGKARASGEVDDAGAGGGGGGYSVFRLHGVLSQADRRAVYQGFAAARAGVLLCTDVGARGLDFTGVGATVQVDPPSDPTTYVHRVGRTARLGREGEAVLFLQPRETEYATVLGDLGVTFCAASVPAMLDVLEGGLDGARKSSAADARSYERNPHLHPAAIKLQKKMHSEVGGDKELQTLAKDAFRSHVRAYATFPADLKHIFHVKRLHLGHVAAAFGLKEAPGLIGKSATRERLQAAKDKRRKESVRAKRDAREKRKRKAEGKMAPRKAARGTIVGAA